MRPRNSWLGKIDRSCRDRLGMDRAAAWEFARGNRLRWLRLVSDATRPLAYAPRFFFFFFNTAGNSSRAQKNNNKKARYSLLLLENRKECPKRETKFTRRDALTLTS